MDDTEICMAPYDGPGAGPGAVAPPVFQASLFTKQSFAELASQQSAEHENYVYSRGTNPTVEFLEQRLALLEGGEAAKCFASGMGAISAVLGGLLSAGDHVLFVNNVYGPTIQLAQRLERFGVEHTVVTDPTADLEPHLRDNTALIYLESPGSGLMRLADVPAIVRLARSRGIRTAMDNTWSTPLYQKPIRAGVDLVVHSLTKYVGGHSDVVGGVVVGSATDVQRIFYDGYLLFGAAMSAMEASLVLRGLRTLPVRLEQHQRNAIRVIDHLRSHREVLAVHHPYAEHAPDDPLLAGQLTGVSGLLSFELRDGTDDRVERFVDALRVFRIGISWGGYESLVSSGQRRGVDPAPMPRGLIRLSVGLEGADAQVADLDRGFAALD